MAAGDLAGQAADDLVLVEIAGHMAHSPMRVESTTIPAGDAGGLLTTVLKGVETQRHHSSGGLGAPNAEYAALFAQLVIIERMRGEHRESHRGG